MCLHNDFISFGYNLNLSTCACFDCREDKIRYGFRKSLIIDLTKYFIMRINGILERPKRIEETIKLFTYVFLTNEGKKFSNDDCWESILKNKLIIFFEQENIRIAYTWYQNIFNVQMPISMSESKKEKNRKIRETHKMSKYSLLVENNSVLIPDVSRIVGSFI